MTATANGQTMIELSWTAPQTNAEWIEGYKIEWSSNGKLPWMMLVADTEDTGAQNVDTEDTSGVQTYYIDRPDVQANTVNDLTEDTTRHYRVSAINYAGMGPVSAPAMAKTSAMGAPGAPAVLMVTANGQTEIVLGWDDVTGATGYKVEWSVDGAIPWMVLVENTEGSGALNAGTQAVESRYTDTGLTAGTTRHYRVSGINIYGAGLASTYSETDHQATTDPVTQGAPGAPRSLMATAVSDTEIKLSWSSPVDPGDTPITGYRIEYSATGRSWAALMADTGRTAPNYTDTSLMSGMTRHYRVAAINSVGQGTASESDSATTPIFPGAPMGLTAMGMGRTQIYLSWTAPEDTGAAAVTGYRIEYSADGGQTWTVLVARQAGTTYSHTRLAAGTTMHYRLSAISSVGTGMASRVAMATTDALMVPGTPTGLMATANGPMAINLAWMAPADNGGADITGYQIETSADGNDPWAIVMASNRGTTYTHMDLDPGTTMHYRVSAINSVGTGMASMVARATTTAAPGMATDLTAMAMGRTQIDLSWTAPSEDGGAAITGYMIESSADGMEWPETPLMADTGSTDTTYSHMGLDPGTTMHYRVSAINSAGTGMASNVAMATTDALMAPGAPTGLMAVANGPMAINLSWTAPTENGGADITGYMIEYSADGSDGSWMDLMADTASMDTTYSDMGLDPETMRHYRVSAINSAGTGMPSMADSATTTTASVEPGMPTDLTAMAMGRTQIDLSWTAPSEDGGAAITGYMIESSADGMEWPETPLMVDTGSTDTTYSHMGLDPGTTMHYRVSAINSAGTGMLSNVDMAMTDALMAPGAPADLTATADGASKIDLAWTAPTETGGADITGYMIEYSADGSDGSWMDLMADTASMDTTYSDMGLDPETMRHYRVSAINSAGTGMPSMADSATTTTAEAEDTLLGTYDANNSGEIEKPEVIQAIKEYFAGLQNPTPDALGKDDVVDVIKLYFASLRSDGS